MIMFFPRENSQVTERENILQVGGFGDACFNVIESFMKYGNSKNHWVTEIENVDIDAGLKPEEESVENSE